MPEEVEEEVSKISMNWPKSLKDAVRDKVGQRKMTQFTIEAVEAKLAGAKPPPPPPPTPIAAPRSEPVQRPIIAAEPEVEPVDDGFDPHAPMFKAPPRTPAAPLPAGDQEIPPVIEPRHQDPHPEVPKDRHGPRGEALLEKLRRQGLVDIKPASEVLKPHPKEESDPGVRRTPAHPTEVPPPIQQAPTVTQVPTSAPPVAKATSDIAGLDVCGNCGSTLIEGECWECG